MKEVKPLVVDADPFDFLLKSLGHNFRFGTTVMLCNVCVCFMQMLQFIVTCSFLGKKYLYYGYDFANFFFKPEMWPHPADYILPEMSKCDWHYINLTGDVSSESVICRLPLNAVYRWIFLVYWFWLILTAVISICCFIYLLILSIYFGFVGIVCCLFKKKGITGIRLNFGDWLLLSFLQLNMDRKKFLELTLKLNKHQMELSNVVP